jgi:retron-type reverse transcriptase
MGDLGQTQRWFGLLCSLPCPCRHSKTKWHSVPWYWRQYTNRISSPARMASDQAHQALDALRAAFMGQGVRWCIDVDIKKYFDTIDHGHLRDFLNRRVTDGVIRRMIDKWLKAGVLEEGRLHRPTAGSGGVVSPCLSNVYLHYVLDEWFERDVRPRLKGRAILVRYADDLVSRTFSMPNGSWRCWASVSTW